MVFSDSFGPGLNTVDPVQTGTPVTEYSKILLTR